MLLLTALHPLIEPHAFVRAVAVQTLSKPRRPASTPDASGVRRTERSCNVRKGIPLCQNVTSLWRAAKSSMRARHCTAKNGVLLIVNNSSNTAKIYNPIASRVQQDAMRMSLDMVTLLHVCETFATAWRCPVVAIWLQGLCLVICLV